MSKKLAEKWASKWDALPGSDFEKAMGLLFEYCGAFKTHPKTKEDLVWGGSLGRFLTFRWNTHHGEAVEKALALFHNDYIYVGYKNEDPTIDDLIEVLNNKIRESKLRMSIAGDLYHIIKTIIIKTNSAAKRLSVISESNNEGSYPLFLLPKSSEEKFYSSNNTLKC